MLEGGPFLAVVILTDGGAGAARGALCRIPVPQTY